MHNWIVLKTVLKFTLKLTLKELQQVTFVKIINQNTLMFFWLIILTNVTLARSNSALPDDGDYTETCWSCFNVNLNVNFKIVFKTIQLCISWLKNKTLIWNMSLKNIVTVVFRLERKKQTNKPLCHKCSSDIKYSTCVTLKWYIYSLTM
jgi:hypothetical protein